MGPKACQVDGVLMWALTMPCLALLGPIACASATSDPGTLSLAHTDQPGLSEGPSGGLPVGPDAALVARTSRRRPALAQPMLSPRQQWWQRRLKHPHRWVYWHQQVGAIHCEPGCKVNQTH